jgi:sec-independent protein translocase protein TatA
MPLGIQPIHIVIIVLVALLIFGPRKLPEMGRSVGKMINEFRNGTRDITDSFREKADRPVASQGNASLMETSTAIPAASSPIQTPSLAPAPVGNFCIQCGAVNPSEAHFCNQCGAKLPEKVNQFPDPSVLSQ